MKSFQNLALTGLMLIIGITAVTSQSSWCPKFQLGDGLTFQQGSNNLYGYNAIYRDDANTHHETRVRRLDHDECVTYIDPTARLPSGCLTKYHAFVSEQPMRNYYIPLHLQIWRHSKKDEEFKIVWNYVAVGPVECNLHSLDVDTCAPVQEGDLLGWTDCGGSGVSREMDSSRDKKNSTLRFIIDRDDIDRGLTLDDDDGGPGKVTFSLAVTILRASYSASTPDLGLVPTAVSRTRKPVPEDTDEEEDKKKDSGPSGGVIAAIVVSVVVCLLVVLCLCLWCCFLSKRKASKQEGKSSTGNVESGSMTNIIVNNLRKERANTYISEFAKDNRKNEIKSDLKEENVDNRRTTAFPPISKSISIISGDTRPTSTKPQPKTTRPEKETNQTGEYSTLGPTSEYLSPSPEYSYTSLILNNNDVAKYVNDVRNGSSKGVEANTPVTTEGKARDGNLSTNLAKSGKTLPGNNSDMDRNRNVDHDGYLEMIYKKPFLAYCHLFNITGDDEEGGGPKLLDD